MNRGGALADHAATLQRATQGDFVGILQIAAHRQARGQARQAHTQRHEHAREVGCGRLTLKVRVHRQNNLLDALIRQAGYQLADAQLLRAHARQRVNSPAEYVVAAGEGTGALNRHDVLGLLDHAQHRRVAALVAADGAQLRLGDVAALLAEAHAGLHRGNRVGQARHIGGVSVQDVKSDALSRLGAHTRQAAELVNEVLYCTLVHASPICRGPR